MSDSLSKDQVLADLARCKNLHVELRGQISVAGDKIVVSSALTQAALAGAAVELRDVPAPKYVDQTWRISGRFGDHGRVEIHQFELEAKRAQVLRTSRTGRRYERPECTATVRGDKGAAVAAECLDLSAGGCGLKTLERGTFQVADLVDVHLEFADEIFVIRGFVAHADGGRVGVRLGIQFGLMDEADALRYYQALNRMAGEQIADTEPTESSNPRFFRAAEHGTTELFFSADFSVVGKDLQVDFPGGSLADCLIQLAVEDDDSAWRARVQHTGDQCYAVRQVGHANPMPARSAGYRVRPPRNADLRVTRRTHGGTLHVELTDLSRGGVGLILRTGEQLRARESVELALKAGDFERTMQGRVVYVRPEDQATRVGVAFTGLDDEHQQALDDFVSGLEDREVFARLLIFGLIAILVLATLLSLGRLVAPDRQPPSPPTHTGVNP